jgi:hypothetical protein
MAVKGDHVQKVHSGRKIIITRSEKSMICRLRFVSGNRELKGQVPAPSAERFSHEVTRRVMEDWTEKTAVIADPTAEHNGHSVLRTHLHIH